MALLLSEKAISNLNDKRKDFAIKKKELIFKKFKNKYSENL